MVTTISANSHLLKTEEKKHKFLLISDLHWDNPKCDRDLLKQHLDQALKEDAKIIMNGDVFCLMQGAYDPRKNKNDIRPEHNVANYLDAVVNTAVEWFKPYAKNILLVGYGNHETSILKRHETDITDRFVSALNFAAGSQVQKGGYSGWLTINYNPKNNHNTGSYRMHYMHGYGGGAPVTKGTIQHNRMSTSIEGADLIWMGHVHNDYEVTYSTTYLDGKHNIKYKDILMVRTPSYKEEYVQGKGGWHVERGAGLKPIGGRWLELEFKSINGQVHKYAHTYKTQNPRYQGS